MSRAHTIRDQLVERFTEEFGEPVKEARTYAWSVTRPWHGSLNIRMDSWATPNEVTLWVFDPARKGSLSAECRRITDTRDVDLMVEQIRRRVQSSG